MLDRRRHSCRWSDRVVRCEGEACPNKAFEWAIGAARGGGCGLVRLTTDNSRPDAHRCYDRLGFVASYEGSKLLL